MIENVLAKDINGLEPRLTELQSELLAAGIPQGTGQRGPESNGGSRGCVKSQIICE